MTYQETVVPEARDIASAFAAAEAVSAVLARTAAASEAAGTAPFAEIDLIRRAGLLRLLAPVSAGGLGGRWADAVRVARTVARANGSVGQLLGYHYLNSITPRVVGSAAEGDRFEAGVAAHGWFVGDSVNPLDPALDVRETAGGYVLNGRKTFSTGALIADRILLAFFTGGLLVFAIIPRERRGLRPNDDFDFVGLRQSASGTVDFDNVEVFADEIVGPGPQDPAALSPRANLLTPLIQNGFTHLYLGIAQGALEEAAEYTRTQSRPWFLSGVEAAVDDPHVQARYGELVAALEASLALAGQASASLEAAIERGDDLTADERAAAAVDAYKAKLHATRTALEVTATIFELTGARSTARHFGLDRFWRDVRTHTLHDPVAYKAREVGAYFLKGQAPLPTFYS